MRSSAPAWALLGACLAGPGFAQEPARDAVPAATLAGVAWIGGHWVDRTPKGLSEEVWTAPEGDSMLGMWRYVSGGKARVLELLAITATADGLELRLRHFDSALVAREEKAQSLVLKAIRQEPGMVAFEGPAVGGEGLVRITYRKNGEDALAVTLEKAGKKEEFGFKRAAAR
jgi:hypothetical protein